MHHRSLWHPTSRQLQWIRRLSFGPHLLAVGIGATIAEAAARVSAAGSGVAGCARWARGGVCVCVCVCVCVGECGRIGSASSDPTCGRVELERVVARRCACRRTCHTQHQRVDAHTAAVIGTAAVAPYLMVHAEHHVSACIASPSLTNKGRHPTRAPLSMVNTLRAPLLPPLVASHARTSQQFHRIHPAETTTAHGSTHRPLTQGSTPPNGFAAWALSSLWTDSNMVCPT